MSTRKTKQQSGLPIVRLSALNPFLVTLLERGCNARQLLADKDLPPGIPASSELFIPLSEMYELVEATAVAAADKYFGFEVGRSLDVRQWDPFRSSAAASATVGELLTRFVQLSGEHATTRFSLASEASRSTFAMERPIDPQVQPAQNDAFYAGVMGALLQEACGDACDASRILASVCDPGAIPSSWKGRVSQSDQRGVRVSFPTEWLFAPFTNEPETAADSVTGLSDSIYESMAVALTPYLEDETLDTDRAARLCGYSRRKLSALLRERGTTIGKEIAALRARSAVDRLTGTNDSIAEVGRSVGYTDAAVFARAFRNWTGMSPNEYRRNQKTKL